MKRIKLTKGKYALVDNEDYEFLSKINWYAQKGAHTFYAHTIPKKDASFSDRPMHRIILNAPKNMDVDHRDGNGLNNQRSNLRLATRSENNWNRTRKGFGASRHVGVQLNGKKDRTKKCWRAKITHKGKVINLGSFKTQTEAAKVYDKKAKELRGEFARTNF